MPRVDRQVVPRVGRDYEDTPPHTQQVVLTHDPQHVLVIDREATVSQLRRDSGAQQAGHADRAYDTRDFVKTMRGLEITPHVAQNTSNRRSAIDERTTRHEGYAISQRKRKRVEEVFG